WTASIIRPRTSSRRRRASSGSRPASRSIDPFRSAKRIVTCFRSPSSAAVDLAVSVTRWGGVDSRSVLPYGPVSAAPHEGQNRDPSGAADEQAGQRLTDVERVKWPWREKPTSVRRCGQATLDEVSCD